MILAIDIGNTNIVVGGCDNDKIVFVERISTDTSKTELEYVVKFHALIDIYNIKMDAFKGAIISSVVPPLNHIIVTAVKKFFGIDPILVGPGIKTGINILMDNPATVGSDLIVNAVAGMEKYGYPLIMIDMGTATTISVLDDKKNYIGGTIMPGVRVSLDSLVNRTSQLPKIALESPGHAIGKNTIDCMKSGIIMGQAASMDGMIDRIWKELGYKTKVVATGGLASRIIPDCTHDIIIDDELTLIGLNIIYEKNRKI